MKELPVQNLEFFFDNIKEGDVVALYNPNWWAFFSKLIKSVTHAPVDHVASIINVRRFNGNSVVFELSEQKVLTGKTLSEYGLMKTKERVISDSRFGRELFYYVRRNYNLTPEQIKNRIKFSREDIGEDYSELELTLTQKWILKLLPFLKKKIVNNPDKYDGFCSALAQVMDYKSGLITQEQYSDNPLPTPIEYIQQDCFKIYKINITSPVYVNKTNNKEGL